MRYIQKKTTKNNCLVPSTVFEVVKSHLPHDFSCHSGGRCVSDDKIHQHGGVQSTEVGVGDLAILPVRMHHAHQNEPKQEEEWEKDLLHQEGRDELKLPRAGVETRITNNLSELHKA